MPNNWINELAAKVEKMNDALAGDGVGWLEGQRVWNDGVNALRNHADRLIAIARAAEAANTAYFGAGNELEAMQNLRAALEAPDGL